MKRLLFVLMLCMVSLSAEAATLYTNADPNTTDINTLSRRQYLTGFGTSTFPIGPWFGVWDDVDYSLPANYTRLWGTGVILDPGVNDTLGQVTIPVQVWYGGQYPLRLEVYQTAATGNATYNTANYTFLEADVQPVVQGRQWLNFQFSGNTSLSDQYRYLFWLSTTGSKTRYAHQGYDWLSVLNNQTTGIRFNKPVWDENQSSIPATDLFYSGALGGAWVNGHAGFHIVSDVAGSNNNSDQSPGQSDPQQGAANSAIPEPLTGTLAIAGMTLLCLRRRRA